MENFWDRKRAAAAARGPDPAPDARRRDPLAEHLRPRDPGRPRRTRLLSQARRRRASSRSSTARTSTGWAGPVENYEVKDGAIVCKPKKGGDALHEGGVRRLRRPARVQAAARRQQRPGDPLPRQGRHGATSACASCRSSTTTRRSTRSSTRGSTTARPTAWSPRTRGYLRPVGEWNFHGGDGQGLDASRSS